MINIWGPNYNGKFYWCIRCCLFMFDSTGHLIFHIFITIWTTWSLSWSLLIFFMMFTIFVWNFLKMEHDLVTNDQILHFYSEFSSTVLIYVSYFQLCTKNYLKFIFFLNTSKSTINPLSYLWHMSLHITRPCQQWNLCASLFIYAYQLFIYYISKGNNFKILY